MQRPTSNETQPHKVEHVRSGFKSVCHSSSVGVIKVVLQLVCTSPDIVRPFWENIWCLRCFLSVQGLSISVVPSRLSLVPPMCPINGWPQLWNGGEWSGGSVLSVAALITACCQDAVQEVYCGRANRLHLSPGRKANGHHSHLAPPAERSVCTALWQDDIQVWGRN